MKKILLSFILAGIGFSTALAQQQTVPGIKATFDGKTVYYKAGEAPVLSYKVDEMAKTKNALIHLKDRKDPVLNVPLKTDKNLTVEQGDYVSPTNLWVSGFPAYHPFKADFPALQVKWNDDVLAATNYTVIYKDDMGSVVVDDKGTPIEPSGYGQYTRVVTLLYPYYGTVENVFEIENRMTFKFNANGGLGEMGPQTFADSDFNNPGNLNVCGFTKEGYHFLGWNQVSTADWVELTDEAEITVSATNNGGSTGQRTLYAIWAKDMELQAKTNLVIKNIPDVVGYGKQIPTPWIYDYMPEAPEVLASTVYTVSYETAEGLKVNGTPSEPGKYNLCAEFKFPYWGTVKAPFEIVDHKQVLKELIEGAAAECKEKTEGQVPDDVHNALDEALEQAIDKAKALVASRETDDDVFKAEIVKVQQAMENSYHQYWFDQLAKTIVTVDVYQMGMSESDAKDKLVEALKTANEVCQGKIDKPEPKSSEVYKEAYDALWAAYQEAIKAEVGTQLAGLYTAIMNATVVKGSDIAYKENQDELQTNGIDVASVIYKTYPKTEYALSDITVLKKAITTLDNKVATVKTSDYNKAKDALTDSIGYATTSKGTIEQVSKVIANALGSAITTAQGVLDATEPAATAKDLKSAAETLGTAKAGAEFNFETFKTVKSNLKDAIDASNTTLAGFDSKHEAIKTALGGAIQAAQGVYTDAINQTIDELRDALTNIQTANDVAKASEDKADQIDAAVTIASTALETIVDTEIKAQLQDAIDDAKEDVKNYAAVEDLDEALTAINDATSQYVSSDIAKARNALNDKISEAQGKIDDVLAYGENKDQLSSDKTTAWGVLINIASTAQKLTAAANTLATAITTIVGNDAQKALNELNDVIANAQNEYTEVNTINTTIAATLKAEIDKAKGLATEGSARDRKTEGAALDLAIIAANTAVGTYNGNVEAIGLAINAAKTLSDQIDDDYTGIKAALADAIDAAKNVLENSMNKTNAEIEQAITTLKSALTEATLADTYAQNLEDQIAVAEDALETIVDPAKQAELQTAINSTKSLFADKTKTSADYTAANTTLSTKIDQIVSDDITLAKNALTGAIGDATNAKLGVVLDESINGIAGVVAEATTTLNKTGVTAMELDDAKDALVAAVAQIVANDLAMAKQNLANAIAEAETAKKPYAGIAENIKNADAKPNYMKLVTDPFTNAIGEATTVKDSETSTSKNMMDKVDALAKAETAMETAYKAQMAIETQVLANVYSSEKYLADEVGKVNNVIADEFKNATAEAAKVYGDILSDPETEYTLADIINARIGMDDEYKTLQNEFDAWKSYIVSLNNLIGEARNVKAGLQNVHQATVGVALQTAISAAQGIYADRANKFSADIYDAISALEEAIEQAKYDDTNWDFTDADLASADSKFKAGKYEAGYAKYTRKGTAIATGNYGTFCMPMDIKVAYEGEDALFSSVYLPAEFAILNPETNILKLFLTKVDEETVIPAGTPFFAQLACADSLVLKNNSALTVAADPTSVVKNPTTIKIYDQTANSSFVTLDKDITFVWNGTYQRTTETADKFIFKTDGSFGKAGASINAFRAYLEKITKSTKVKSIERIDVEFGEDNEATGISNITVVSSDGSQIFSIDGKKMSGDMKSLNKGAYIVNGKKVLK